LATVRAPVDVGATIAGKYRVDRVIGAGGMGVVVAATHLQLDQKVAIKFLLSTHAQDEVEVARFAREARALAKIESDHVARVIDVGSLDDGASYMVMEYLEGQDLAAILRERGPIPYGQAIRWVLEACEAVIEAHAAGIVHRDLKPANLFLAQRKNMRTIVKVLDFGISKAMAGASAVTMDMLALTKTAALLGSPLYMAPEQLRSVKDLDGRTDVWGIGVILYELLTAHPPFMADSLGALVSSIQEDQPMTPHLRVATIPPEVSSIVLTCLSKKREDRFPTVTALANMLQPFASLSSSASNNTPPPAVSPSGPAVISNLASTTGPGNAASSPVLATTPRPDWVEPQASSPPKPKPKTALTVIAVVVGVGLAIAVGAIVLAKTMHETQPTYASPHFPTPPAPSESQAPPLPEVSAAPSASASAAAPVISSTAVVNVAKPKPAVPSAAPSASASAKPAPMPTETIPALPSIPIK